jgi:hypothetical protein
MSPPPKSTRHEKLSRNAAHEPRKTNTGKADREADAKSFTIEPEHFE